MVFAKKAKSDNIEGGLYQSDILSYTYKKKVTLLVSKEWLSASDKVLIIDDFMARGEAMRGLCDIVREAGAELVGIGVAVEKGFQHGGDRLRERGIRVQLYAEQKKFKAKIQYADKLHIPYVIFLGEDEVAAGTVSLKDLRSGEQITVPAADAAERILADIELSR